MSSAWSPSPQELADLDELWVSAEACVKDFERTYGHVLMPAVNELRYSGRHLIDALLGDPKHFELARRHALRAKYDAAEARILMSLQEIESFRSNYKKEQLSGVVPNWLEIRKLARTVQKRIGENRAKERRERREEDHEIFLQHAGALEEAVETLADAREELNKTIEDRRIEARRFLFGTVIIGLAGLVIGTLAIVLC